MRAMIRRALTAFLCGVFFVVGVLGTVALADSFSTGGISWPLHVPSGLGAVSQLVGPSDQPFKIADGGSQGEILATTTPNVSSPGSVGAHNEAWGAFASAAGDNSVSMGYSASANWTNAVAIGANTNANDDSTVAVGGGANAYVNGGCAFGPSAAANGSDSVSVGSSTSAGADSVCVGAFASAFDSDTIAIGYFASSPSGTEDSIVIGPNASSATLSAVAIGQSSSANGGSAVTIGRNATTYGANSVAIGPGSTANGANVISIGNGTSSSGDNSLVIGAGSTSAAGGVVVGENSASTGGGIVIGNNAGVGADWFVVGGGLHTLNFYSAADITIQNGVTLTGGISLNVLTVNATSTETYTTGPTVSVYFVSVDAAHTLSVKLPSAVTWKGRTMGVVAKSIGAGGAIQVTTASGNVNGSGSPFAMTALTDKIFCSDGTDWWTLN